MERFKPDGIDGTKTESFHFRKKGGVRNGRGAFQLAVAEGGSALPG